MVRRLGPTPRFPQTTHDVRASLDALQRASFDNLTEILDRLRDVLPKDGTEPMEGPLPFFILTTAQLPPAADWEGAVVYNNDINRLVMSNGADWITISGGGLFGRPAFGLSSTPTALTAELSGTLIINFGSNREVDLPAPTSGLSYAFWTGSGTLTLDILGSEAILWPDGTMATGSYVLASGNQCILTADGNNWIAYAPNFNQLTAFNIIRKQSDPNEGGQLEWELGSNSTLTNDRVMTDFFDNNFRIFENGGNFRGFQIPIGDLAASAVSLVGMWRMASGSLSNVASLSIVLPNASFRMWKVHLTDWVPVTDNVTLQMRTSTNGGSSYDSGASDYAWTRHFATSGGGGTTGVTVDAADSQINLVAVVGNNTGEHLNAEIMLYELAATSRYKSVQSHAALYDAGPDSTIVRAHGSRLATADVDAFQFFFSSGNISVGEWALYGVE